jgi:hypothetical protein
MNLKLLNLDQDGIPDDISVQIPVFLIAEELKARKLFNALKNIGCDGSFCITDLCDLVFAYIGFEDRPDHLYEFYFSLLDRYCDKVSQESDRPIKYAHEIFTTLVIEKEKQRTSIL